MLNEVFDKEAFEKSKQEIKELCNRFDYHKEDYLKKTYKEAEVRKDFIDYFFKALGWDVDNTQGFSPVFREVKVEETIDVGGKSKNPDYTFQIGGQKIFFVEAKAPHVNLENNPKPANQLRRYGWNAELEICLLTDFQELMVYETKMMPDEKLPASAGRVKKYKYTEYVDKWEEIYTIFSKEGVMKGFFDDFANSSEVGSKTGTARVDSEFLKDIENWRLLLARNIALRNKELTIEELNLAVQLIIDRIVFFRMAEDRGIERQKTLYKLAKSKNIYEQLCEVFKKADLKYNSGLFHFNITPDYSEFVDNITLHLNIDDGVFKEIFKNLYYPFSPYEFSIISPEILGSIYENFLGSQIRLTKSHQARVELKPEVQKAGGVYYTPQYIADYIVDNTVGKLIEGKTPNQISELKIVDIACGSGSFLLRAYQKLLDYHLEYYINLNKTPKDVYYTGKDGIPRLTIREKKRILTNNIFGVDIDVNAVEVTKLSLLLKVLEDENKDVLEQQQKLFQEKVLPNLSYNIKCGNSLVNNSMVSDLDLNQILDLNPFDWEKEFQEIFEKGGFDIVIGNPPYVSAKVHAKLNGLEREVLRENYNLKGSFDLYIAFLHKGVELTNDKGMYSWIIPNKFLTSEYAKDTFEVLVSNGLYSSVDVSIFNVFKNASVYPIIIVADKRTNKSFKKYEVKKLADLRNNNLIEQNKTFNHDFKTFKDFGIKIASGTTGFQAKQIKPLIHDEDEKKEGDIPFAVSGSIDPYIKDTANVRYMKDTYTNPFISFNKKSIAESKWNFWCSEKIVIAGMTKRLEAFYSKEPLALGVGCYGIYDYANFNPYFLLGCLNSKFFTYYFNELFKDKHLSGGYLAINKGNLLELPLKIPNEELETQIIESVKSLLYLISEKDQATTPNKERILSDQIDTANDKINQLIYELYELTDDEIAIIEEMV